MDGYELSLMIKIRTAIIASALLWVFFRKKMWLCIYGGYQEKIDDCVFVSATP